MERLGRIDVLVDNTGNFQPGFFEEISPAQFRAQMETNLFGPLDVTRAVLPIMRRQRPGHVVTITSTAGIVSGAFGSAYGASKFALEGWMESLRGPLRPAGADAVEAIARKGRALSDPATALQELSTALDHVEGV